MKKAMKTEADTPVCLSKDGKPMTVNELFKSMNVTSHDLSIDLLDVHADRDTFQRFDKFNAKFNQIDENVDSESELRRVDDFTEFLGPMMTPATSPRDS